MTENAIFLHTETQTLCSYECIFIFWEDEPGLKIDISLHKPPITPNRTHMVSRDPLPPFYTFNMYGQTLKTQEKANSPYTYANMMTQGHTIIGKTHLPKTHI